MAATETPIHTLVCDAGPLIHLDELNCLTLLSDFSRVLLPGSVWEEVSRHRSRALDVAQVELEYVTVYKPLPSQLSSLQRLFALHQAELDALQLAHELKAELFITDDTAARLAARQLAIPVHGTIGIVVRAIRRGQKSKDEVLDILRSLPTLSTLHIRRSFLNEIIGEIERSNGRRHLD